MFFLIDWVVKRYKISRIENIIISAGLLVAIILFFTCFGLAAAGHF